MKSKQSTPAPAEDLYTSPLFIGRRSFVERTCDRWFILSAEHGLVEPKQVLSPYDRALKNASRSEKEEWSADVLATLERVIGDLQGITFEIHAGVAYIGHGLTEGLQRRGALVDTPAKGLGLGHQLVFYRDTLK